MAGETYQEFQARTIREARRAQERADAEFAGQRLKARGGGWTAGYQIGRDEEAARRRWDWLAWAVIGAIVGFVLGVFLRPQFWGL